MKKIPLTQGQFAIVDDEDYELLSKHKWSALWFKNMQNFYAMRNIRTKNGKKYLLSMAREILGLKYGDKRHTDHKNHITLDNRKSNIRICTPSENQHNQKPQLFCTSKYKGVMWHKIKNKWQSHIHLNQKTIHLGYFNTEKEAALAYNRKAKELFGEFAWTNFEE